MVKPASITSLCDGIRAASITYPSSKSCAEKAANLFMEAFDLFGHCHRGYSSSHYMNDEAVTDLGNVKIYKY